MILCFSYLWGSGGSCASAANWALRLKTPAEQRVGHLAERFDDGLLVAESAK